MNAVDGGAVTASASVSVPAVVEVEGLRVTISPRGGRPVAPVQDVDLRIRRGEVVGLVGESGSGKTMLARAVAGLLAPGLRPRVEGRIHVLDRELGSASAAERRATLRTDLSYVFQDPNAHLNPTTRIGDQVAEVAVPNGNRVEDLFRSVGLPTTEEFARRYPHQLSGGMKQRVVIACALAKDPGVIIADEPTTALDVTIQAQVLRLLRDLATTREVGILLVSHDLAAIGQFCDSVAVMYAGRIVEEGPTSAILRTPRHPYTKALMGALFDIHTPEHRPVAIPGSVPALDDPPDGCRFGPRCGYRTEHCDDEPELIDVGPGRRSRCWNWERL
ncbi:ABC transporter ATP-binding protein [Nonomuraea sp. MG754425]|uniref:ABC transporter ATP-binding protein n=1 Tax=Nonomuraea sp. MG754425 TaxID=2570319 RepID=UPI001F2B3D28|nr:ABC transporter ATP-binding protein [Nonomuraea sp. MG754425]MCF6474336.1 ABC transporter ATP-binding protein [Nonomuraea sp. MG754425]